ncbi:MAG TPA: site-specific integrase, partial [Gaiellaceae bacterium]|nr:site-specific integrase [Gaiellaceae bacterium]
MEGAIERFLASPSLSEGTRRSYRFDLEPFAAWLGKRGTALEDVDARALADYAAELGRDRRKLAPATISRKLAAIRSFL